MVRKRRDREAANPMDGSFLGRWSRRKVRAKTDAPPDTLAEDLTAEAEAGAVGVGNYQRAGYQPGRMITDAPIDHDAPDNRDAGDSDATASGAGRPAGELASLDPSAAAAGDVADERSADNGMSDEDFAAQDWDKFDFDALHGESDYARFMGKNIPDHIRAKALKKLWTSNPLFGHMDLLDDYAEDFSDAVWVVPNLRTDYKVGRGFMTDEEVAEWEALGAESKQRAAEEQLARDKAKRDGDGDSDGPRAGDKIVIAPETPDQPDVIVMLKAAEDYHRAAYPAAGDDIVPLADLLAPNVRFLVVRAQGEVAGCGALVFGNDDSAELKRMWVDPEMRGEGLGRALLDALESEARKLNVTRLRLWAGIDDVAALKLYRGCGYEERNCDDPDEPASHQVYMEKPLAPAEKSTD